MRNYPYLAILLAGMVFTGAPSARADDGTTASPPKPAQEKPGHAPVPPRHVDRSGRKQHGKASYYSHKFAHKKTASGLPLDPNKKTAASKTLPLGTKAEVTNLENGKKTEVIVNDRGPYVPDRVIDVTPKAAQELGIKEEGVAKVEVKPVAIPPPEADPKEEVLKQEKTVDPPK